ncbi:hypothetical protein HK102_008902, partial [Quaeritorhiza haematococci]
MDEEDEEEMGRGEVNRMGYPIVTEGDVEREFWRLVESIYDDVEVEYGADLHSSVHGSGFPVVEKHPHSPYSRCGWNLNNIPILPSSLLSQIRTDVSGMMVPWLYVGMVFSTFCWHTEDHFTYSINYLHWGETKTWYGIPASDADAFEKAMRSAVPELFETNPDLLFHLTTMLSPGVLVKNGVKCYAADQREGEFVITFPRAYHAGFNHGFNFAEAVNFALPDWLPFGLHCAQLYSMFKKLPVFSHDELVLRSFWKAKYHKLHGGKGMTKKKRQIKMKEASGGGEGEEEEEGKKRKVGGEGKAGDVKRRKVEGGAVPAGAESGIDAEVDSGKDEEEEQSHFKLVVGMWLKPELESLRTREISQRQELRAKYPAMVEYILDDDDEYRRAKAALLSQDGKSTASSSTTGGTTSDDQGGNNSNIIKCWDSVHLPRYLPKLITLPLPDSTREDEGQQQQRVRHVFVSTSNGGAKSSADASANASASTSTSTSIASTPTPSGTAATGNGTTDMPPNLLDTSTHSDPSTATGTPSRMSSTQSFRAASPAMMKRKSGMSSLNPTNLGAYVDDVNFDIPQCARCKTYCYITVARCNACMRNGQFACLAHIDEACRCIPGKKAEDGQNLVMCSRFGDETLREIAKDVGTLVKPKPN